MRGKSCELTRACACILLAAVPAAGQSTLDWPVGEFVSYTLDSGMRGNPAKDSPVVYEATITVEDAVWLRIYFGEVELGKGSFVRMVSALDGEVQRLNASAMAMWNSTSAYFNGDTVYLELIAGPETTRNRIALDRVAVQFVEVDGLRGPCADDDCGICGADNRVPSDVEWSGRIMPAGCTGSVYNPSSCVVGAGHCSSGGYDDVLQFNVPDSEPNCYPNNPPVNDQFPITGHLFNNNGVGDDWSVMTTGTNNIGETPFERYGVFTPLALSPANPGNTCAIWGYGVDNGEPTRSQTQQTSSGSINTRYSSYYTFTADITYGNSGSGLVRGGEIVGIVTHCTMNCPNVATRIDNSDFELARQQLCPDEGGYCAAYSISDAYEYISNVSVGSIYNNSGPSTYSDFTDLSTSMQIGVGYPITVTLNTEYTSDIGGLWVDWNQDEDFEDADETITTSWSGVGPYNTTITPPAGAAEGMTRMRVRIQDGQPDPILSPCGSTLYGEVEDYSINVIWSDATPPYPDPMTFDVEPYGTTTSSVSMFATTANDDDSPPVSYYFDFVAGGTGGSDSGWQSGTLFTDNGLLANTLYTYRVKARDSASPANETAYSEQATTATLIETPTGVAFGTVTNDSIQLQATGALTNLDDGASGVYFDSTTGGGDGGINAWVQAPTDTATGLEPDASYTFRVKARNQDAIETGYSASSSKATLANTPGPPILDTVDCSSMTIDVAPDGNPWYTTYAIRCTFTWGYDGDWYNKYVSASGEPVSTPVWRTDAQWNVTLLTGMKSDTAYDFRVTARNQESVSTEQGPAASATTTHCGDGDLDNNGDVDLLDFAAWQRCYDVLPVAPECQEGDFDGDGVVDLDDYAAFADSMTGPS
jgi:hypothetical protein